MAILEKVVARRSAKKGEKDTSTSVTATPVSARDHGSSDDTNMWVVSKAKSVSETESCSIIPSLTRSGVVANVPRRNGSVGPINRTKNRGFTEDQNTVHEQPPISADIEHFVHIISAFAVRLVISFLIIGYGMGASVPEGLLLIGQTIILKYKRMLATIMDANAGDKMGTLTQNSLMNGDA